MYYLIEGNGNNFDTFNEDGSFSCTFQNTKVGNCDFGIPMNDLYDQTGHMTVLMFQQLFIMLIRAILIFMVKVIFLISTFMRIG